MGIIEDAYPVNPNHSFRKIRPFHDYCSSYFHKKFYCQTGDKWGKLVPRAADTAAQQRPLEFKWPLQYYSSASSLLNSFVASLCA
jgi:hypothetical protein